MIAAILKAVDKEETRTKITYRAMLSHDQCKLYLDSLTKSGLLHKINDGGRVVYRTTPKGVRFLSYYNKLKELLPLVNDEALAGILV